MQLSGREELARYEALRGPGKQNTPLAFWQDNSKEFPLLSEVARRVLCFSASSEHSERDFSSVPCYKNMTSAVKPEVHNVLQRRQRKNEPRDGQHAQKFGEVLPHGFRVMRADRRADRQTQKQTD